MNNIMTVLKIGLIALAVIMTSCAGGGPAAQLGLDSGTYGEAQLTNGAKLLIHPAKLDESPLVSIAMRLPAGVDSEKSGEAGYSSLLARVLAGSGEGSASAVLAGMGSELTVGVQADAMVLETTVLRDDVQAAYEAIIASINRDFGTVDFLSAKDRLVSDLETAADPVRRLLNETLFSGSSRAVSAGDRIEALNSINAESFTEFANRVLDPANITIAVVGALDNQLLDAIVKESEKLNAKGATGETAGDEAEPEEDDQVDNTPIIVFDRPGNASGLFLLRRMPGLEPKTFYRLEALNLILNGQSTYGRLTAAQVSLRLPRSLDSALDLRANQSSHVVSTTVDTARAAEAFAAVMQEMQRLYSGTVLNSRITEQEIADSRNFLTGRLLRRTETSAQLARFLAWSADYGFPGHLPENHLVLIESLDKESLLETIARNFAPRLNALIAVGPADELQGQLADYGEVRIVR